MAHPKANDSFFPLINSTEYGDEQGAELRTVIAMHLMAARRTNEPQEQGGHLAEGAVKDADALIKELGI